MLVAAAHFLSHRMNNLEIKWHRRFWEIWWLCNFDHIRYLTKNFQNDLLDDDDAGPSVIVAELSSSSSASLFASSSTTLVNVTTVVEVAIFAPFCSIRRWRHISSNQMANICKETICLTVSKLWIIRAQKAQKCRVEVRHRESCWYTHQLKEREKDRHKMTGGQIKEHNVKCEREGDAGERERERLSEFMTKWVFILIGKCCC